MAGAAAAARRRVLRRLQAFIPPELMLPDRRLEELVEQVDGQAGGCARLGGAVLSSRCSWRRARGLAGGTPLTPVAAGAGSPDLGVPLPQLAWRAPLAAD